MIRAILISQQHEHHSRDIDWLVDNTTPTLCNDLLPWLPANSHAMIASHRLVGGFATCWFWWRCSLHAHGWKEMLTSPTSATTQKTSSRDIISQTLLIPSVRPSADEKWMARMTVRPSCLCRLFTPTRVNTMCYDRYLLCTFAYACST